MFGQVLRHKRRGGDLMPREFERYPKGVRTDFRKCESSTLTKYLDHFKADVAGNPSGTELAGACARHFKNDLSVVEEEAVQKFVSYINSFSSTSKKEDKRSRGRGRSSRYLTDNEDSAPQLYCICKRVSFGEMIACDNQKCHIEWFHVGCVGVDPGAEHAHWFCPTCRESKEEKKEESDSKERKYRTGRRASGVDVSSEADDIVEDDEGGAKSSHTYSGMITAALKMLPNSRGTFRDICEQIEKKFKTSLNWKAESDLRKTPVWKSSVRKILISNSKFKKVDYLNNVYTLK